VLYRVIDEHLDAFLETTRRKADGVPLPAFVEQEFYDFLTCGILAHGFARLRRTECALERLVPFSCKGRGFCPSCGGRRMTERAARLVDGVLPRVPVRQWVRSLPYRLRYLLAWDHGLARAVLAVSVRVLLGFQRHRARRYGIRDALSVAGRDVAQAPHGLLVAGHEMAEDVLHRPAILRARLQDLLPREALDEGQRLLAGRARLLDRATPPGRERGDRHQPATPSICSA